MDANAEDAAFALREVCCSVWGGGGTAVLAMKESRSFSWYTAARPESPKPRSERSGINSD